MRTRCNKLRVVFVTLLFGAFLVSLIPGNAHATAMSYASSQITMQIVDSDGISVSLIGGSYNTQENAPYSQAMISATENSAFTMASAEAQSANGVEVGGQAEAVFSDYAWAVEGSGDFTVELYWHTTAGCALDRPFDPEYVFYGLWADLYGSFVPAGGDPINFTPSFPTEGEFWNYSYGDGPLASDFTFSSSWHLFIPEEWGGMGEFHIHGGVGAHAVAFGIPEPSTGIPEPSTMLLLASSLLGLAGFRRKSS